ncbi:hypothetical protein EJ08DRAFT_697553 [Tothia fuscella]|uniref:Uncharacterized protein n=1 Tax=Tothia fuscella TaxID=1048955 RepID=A0A9P4NRC8_9PEZI|nr:hypothetical protein EJ08DRAFT_697553 [Tothia fuscella]
MTPSPPPELKHHAYKSYEEDNDYIHLHYPAPLLQPSVFPEPQIPLARQRGRSIRNTRRISARTIITMLKYLFGGSSSKKNDTANTTGGNDEDDFEVIDKEEASAAHASGWSLEADKHLCVLWFFTPHSLSTISSLLNYTLSSANKPPTRFTTKKIKERLQLLQSKTYDRAFIYHQTEKLVKEDNYSAEIAELNNRFGKAMATMRAVAEREEFDVQQRGEMGLRRRWNAAQRKKLIGKKFRGLERVAKGVRPVVLGDDYDSDVSVDGKA